MLGWIVEDKKIAPHIPVWDKSQRNDGTLAVGHGEGGVLKECHSERRRMGLYAFRDSIHGRAVDATVTIQFGVAVDHGPRAV